MEKFVLSSAMTQKPVFNHTNKTITVTDKFMKEAAKPFTNEFNDLMMLCERCPGYKVITRSHRRPSTSIIQNYLAREGVKLNHEAGDRAFYNPSTDSITLPTMNQFAETSEYYSTAFHELTHSTGHSKRLNRLEKTAYFGSEAYSKEELIAEIGASALVNAAGLETTKSFRNNAAYIQNWLTVLRSDKRFIVSASGKAEKAVALILGSAS